MCVIVGGPCVETLLRCDVRCWIGPWSGMQCVMPDAAIGESQLSSNRLHVFSPYHFHY
jgi:hypothetical protein